MKKGSLIISITIVLILLFAACSQDYINSNPMLTGDINSTAESTALTSNLELSSYKELIKTIKIDKESFKDDSLVNYSIYENFKNTLIDIFGNKENITKQSYSYQGSRWFYNPKDEKMKLHFLPEAYETEQESSTLVAIDCPVSYLFNGQDVINAEQVKKIFGLTELIKDESGHGDGYFFETQYYKYFFKGTEQDIDTVRIMKK